MDTRAPKEIMTRIVCSLEESGEQDICSLLNEVMQVESVYGTGAEVAVFVRALLGFERAGLIGLRDYVVRGARTQVGGRFGFADRDWRAAFAFDRVQSSRRTRPVISFDSRLPRPPAAACERVHGFGLSI